MIRTRFAPSPTGYMHIGNLRTALYEYLIAKMCGGKFILRIEDTDINRFVEDSVDIIYKTLELAGIKYDEGPNIGGDYGPYIQSLRKSNYIDYAKELIEKEKAYYCFCDKERLDSIKNENGIVKYDRHCVGLKKEEIDKNLSENKEYVIRQKIKDGSTTFTDEVYGEITIQNEEMEDQILIKSDGLPTYNFANVIDDHLMNITHVIRGSEYLSSTPKYNLLYEALGFEIPTYIHIPPVMKNQTEKLSKRNGDASFIELIDKGYLPEAIINYIALLGWAPSSNKEIFTLDELVKEFSIKGISKSPAVFDIVKLSWLNSEYIKNMDFDLFYEKSESIIKSIVTKDYDYKKIAYYIKSRLSTISYTEIKSMIDFIEQISEYSTELYISKKMKTNEENSLLTLKEAITMFENIKNWNNDTIYEKMIDLAKTLEVKNSIVFAPIRVALSGKNTSPCGSSEMAELFGKEETLNRIKEAIQKLSS